MNQGDWLFEDSEYLFNIQSFNIKLERVTERGRLKLSPTEVMDVRLGRSIHQFIHINITFHYQWTRWIISSSKCPWTKFDRIQMWKIYYWFIQIIQILDITVDMEFWNAIVPNSMEFKCGRSIHYLYHIYYTFYLKWRCSKINRSSIIIRFRIICFNRSNFDRC